MDQFRSNLGQAIKLTLIDAQQHEMDANSDGSVDVSDARYLARVNIGMLRFLRDVSIRPVQHAYSGGVVSINATLYGKGNVIEKGLVPPQVYLDLASPDASTDAGFALTEARGSGRKLSVAKGSGLHGAILQMKLLGPVYDGGMATIQPGRCRERSNDNGLCNNDEVSDSTFWYNFDTEECEPLLFSSCSGTKNLFATFTDCTSTCAQQFVYSSKVYFPIVAQNIGVSFVILAYDSAGKLSNGRDALLTSTRTPYEYSSKLDIKLLAQSSMNSSPRYSVALVATQGYSPLLHFNNTLSSADAKNEYAPIFEDAQLNVTVSEATLVNSTLSTLTASDGDKFDDVFPLTYKFDHADAFEDKTGLWYFGPFSLHPTSAELKLVKPVDFENTTTHTVDVTVADNAPPFSRSGSTRLVVYVTDANDNRPKFQRLAYNALLSPVSVKGTAIARMGADDADSGQNSMVAWSIVETGASLPFYMDDQGMIMTDDVVRHVTPQIYDFTVRATDKGSPALSSDVSVSLTVTSEDHLFTLAIAEKIKVFAENTNPDSGIQICVEQLNVVFSNKLVIHEVARGVTAGAGISFPLTDLTFYVMKDVASGALMTKTEINNRILANLNKLSIPGCHIYEFNPHSKSNRIATVQFFADNYCSVPLGQEGGLFGPSSRCVGDIALRRSARLVCDDSNPSPKTVRVYDNANCNTPEPFVSAKASDVYAGGQAVVVGQCSQITFLGLPGPPMFVKASCSDTPPPTREDGSIVIENSTAPSVPVDGLTSLPPLVGGANITINTTNATAPTNTTDAGDDVVLEEEEEIDVAAAGESGLSSGAIAGLAVGCILIWILLVLVVLRIQKQRKQLIDAKLLVLAHQGDVQFGTPEPMHKELEGQFTGGEIDPITGEMTLYKNTEEEADTGDSLQTAEDSLAPWDTRLPSVWSGQRANPMMFNLDMGDAGGASEGEDSLGDLSDFEDADFEAFADSLLDDNLDAELFGYNAQDASPTQPGMFKNPPLLGETDSLSDFENDGVEDISELDIDSLGSPIHPTLHRNVLNNRKQSVMGSPIQLGQVSVAQVGGNIERPMSVDSLDLELDLSGVVAHTQYESLGQKVQDQVVTVNTAPNTAFTQF